MSKPNRDDLAGHLRTVRARLSDLGPGPGTMPRVLQAFDHLTELARARAYPRGGSGGGRGAGGHSDPTAQSATDEQRRQEAAALIRVRDQMFKALESAATGMTEAEEIVDRILNPKTPVKHEPGCENCNSVKGNDGRPHELSWQKVKARGVCGWCYRFQYGDGPDRPGYGVPPSPELLRWHLDHLGREEPNGEQVPRAMIRDHMPEAFAAREARKRRPGICHHPTGKDGAPCVREFMHDGQCMSQAPVTVDS